VAIGVLISAVSASCASPSGKKRAHAGSAKTSLGASGASGAPGTASSPNAPGVSSSSTSARKTGTSEVAPGSSAAWTTYGGNFSRTSLDSADPARSSTPVEAWRSEALDGTVYGEPLVYRGTVFVATENDTVYAFSQTTGAVVWGPDHLATPASSGALPCGDITPTVGITSTMVIDPSTGVLYASAETSSGSSNGVGHLLFAINSSTGKVSWSRDLDRSWNSSAELQRIGLALSSGNVLVGFGGNYGDCGSYNGWVIGVPESGSGALATYKVPTAREGAIWAPAGVTVDSSGDVYVATGNGSASQGQAFDHGDAVIKLSPQLQELSYFAPSNWAQDNSDDGDLGSTPPVLLGNGQLFEVGKEQTAYLLNASSLGGIGGQLASLNVCSSKGGSAYEAPSIYVVCDSLGQISQVHVGPGNSLGAGWTWYSPTGGASSPTIAGGVLWCIDLAASRLYGVDLSNGTTRFVVPLDVGALSHFSATSAAGGMLFVAGHGGVEAFR
jgi:hypothetical protein